jgi:hypothetical protein
MLLDAGLCYLVPKENARVIRIPLRSLAKTDERRQN